MNLSTCSLRRSIFYLSSLRFLLGEGDSFNFLYLFVVCMKLAVGRWVDPILYVVSMDKLTLFLDTWLGDTRRCLENRVFSSIRGSFVELWFLGVISILLDEPEF